MVLLYLLMGKKADFFNKIAISIGIWTYMDINRRRSPIYPFE